MAKADRALVRGIMGMAAKAVTEDQLVAKLKEATVALRDAELAEQAKAVAFNEQSAKNLEPVRAAYRDALNAFNAHVAPVKQ